MVRYLHLERCHILSHLHRQGQHVEQEIPAPLIYQGFKMKIKLLKKKNNLKLTLVSLTLFIENHILDCPEQMITSPKMTPVRITCEWIERPCVLCTVYSQYSVQCTVYSQYSVQSVQCTVSTVRWANSKRLLGNMPLPSTTCKMCGMVTMIVLIIQSADKNIQFCN